MENTKEQKYIHVGVDPETHRIIKTKAARLGITITQFVNDAISGDKKLKDKVEDELNSDKIKISPNLQKSLKSAVEMVEEHVKNSGGSIATVSTPKFCKHGAIKGLCKKGCK